MKTSLQTYQPISYRRMISRRGNCGLRTVALLNLKIEDTSTSLSADIESKRVMLGINKGKGAKDREVLISEKMIKLLGEHYRYEKPKLYLFEEQMLGEKYNERSLQQALKKPRIKKPINLHWLQHSHATQLLEGGTDLRYIQEFLGRKSSKTTEINTYFNHKSLQNIRSPFDDL